MNATAVVDRLRQIHFLADVDQSYLEQIAAAGRIVHYPPGRVIFREGQALGAIYLIIAGHVSLELCAASIGCKRIMTLCAGDLLGISPLLEQTRATATARTTADCELIEIQAGQILTLCEHDPRFGYEFMRRVALAISKRLNATRLQMIDVYGEQLPPAGDAAERGR